MTDFADLPDADKARTLLDDAMRVHPVPPERAIAAAAAYIHLAQLQPVDAESIDDLIRIDLLCNDAGVPPADSIPDRVAWLIEQWVASRQPKDGRY